MELLKTEIVKLGDLEFYVRYSNRALIAHLNRSAKEPDNLELSIYYFYDVAKTGAKAEGKQFKYSFDEFYDAIDPYPDAMEKFNEAISKLFGPAQDKKKLKP
jgi:hypothetical protein